MKNKKLSVRQNLVLKNMREGMRLRLCGIGFYELTPKDGAWLSYYGGFPEYTIRIHKSTYKSLRKRKLIKPLPGSKYEFVLTSKAK